MSQERVSGFPEKGADLRGSLGNFRGSQGNFRGSLGNFRGTSGLLLSSTVRELPGEVAEKLPGKFGELPRKSADFPETQGSLTPSQRLAKFVSKQIEARVLWARDFSPNGPGSRESTNARTKHQPKEEVFGTDIPRVSFARISRPKTSARAVKILEKHAFRRGYP